MSVALPDWWSDNFVDVEQLCIDLFARLLPGVQCGCWTPDDWLDSPSPDPMLLFFRLPGGHVDYDKAFDEAVVQATAVTASRDDSWRLLSVVRGVLLPMQGAKVDMADGYTAQVRSAGEVTGPMMLTAGQQVDTRLVSASFKLSVGLRSRDRYLDRLRAA